MLTLKDYTELYTQAFKRNRTILKLTSWLREYGFVFITEEVLEIQAKGIQVKEEHKEYSFMVLRKKNSYDCFLAIGIKLVGNLSEDVHIYVNHHYFETRKLELHRKENFRKVKAKLKFPKQMNYQERKDWRTENDKITKKPELLKTASKFYKKWASEIIYLTP